MPIVAPIWGFPNNKDYSTLGSILGSPYFGKLLYNPQKCSCCRLPFFSIRSNLNPKGEMVDPISFSVPVFPTNDQQEGGKYSWDVVGQALILRAFS